jgi:hypothetical protein
MQCFSRTAFSTKRNMSDAFALQSFLEKKLLAVEREGSASPRRGAALVWGIFVVLFPVTMVLAFLAVSQRVSVESLAATIWLVLVSSLFAVITHITLLISEWWRQRWMWGAFWLLLYAFWLVLGYRPIAGMTGSWEAGATSLLIPLLLVGSWAALRSVWFGRRRVQALTERLEQTKKWQQNLEVLARQAALRQA